MIGADVDIEIDFFLVSSIGSKISAYVDIKVFI